MRICATTGPRRDANVWRSSRSWHRDEWPEPHRQGNELAARLPFQSQQQIIGRKPSDRDATKGPAFTSFEDLQLIDELFLSSDSGEDRNARDPIACRGLEDLVDLFGRCGRTYLAEQDVTAVGERLCEATACKPAAKPPPDLTNACSV